MMRTNWIKMCIVAIIALTFGVIVGSLPGWSQSFDKQKLVQAQKQMSGGSSAGGRFQIYFSPLARADTYLVDTEGGDVWTSITYTNLRGEPQVWRKMYRVDSDSDFSALIDAGVFKIKEKP